MNIYGKQQPKACPPSLDQSLLSSEGELATHAASKP